MIDDIILLFFFFLNHAKFFSLDFTYFILSEVILHLFQTLGQSQTRSNCKAPGEPWRQSACGVGVLERCVCVVTRISGFQNIMVHTLNGHI